MSELCIRFRVIIQLFVGLLSLSCISLVRIYLDVFVIRNYVSVELCFRMTTKVAAGSTNAMSTIAFLTSQLVAALPGLTSHRVRCCSCNKTHKDKTLLYFDTMVTNF